VVTGGNGRQPDLGQVAYYQFQVPAGPIDRTLRADVQLADHATDPVVAYLVDPEGQTPSVAIDAVVTRIGKSGPSEKATSAVEVAATTPAQGRWTLILDFAPAITGNRLSTPYEGTVTLAAGPAKGSGLPVSASTTLPAGKAFAADVVVRNTSDATVDYFLDPRDDRTAMVQLAGQSPTSITLPMAAAQASPSWLVPADTSSVTLSGQAPVPLTFDWGPGIGDPDLGATTAGDTATGAWTAPPVTSGLWFADPSELGPYGAKPAPTEPSSLYATVRTEAFDRSVTSPTGDLWLRSVTTSAPLTVLAVRPGATAEIPVTITPSAKSGTVVSGTVYVDELAEVPSSVANAFNYQPAQTYFESASQVAALPFQYQVG
jgi:hypothetical protein